MMKRLTIALIAAIGNFTALSASAQTLADYDIYSQGAVALSGSGPYGAIAGTTIAGSPGSYSSFVQSNAALTASAADFSASLNSLPSNGAFSLVGGLGTFASLSGGAAVFDITSVQFNSISQLVFSGPGSAAIINVSGKTIVQSVNMNFGALPASNVVFNFFEATGVTLSNAAVPGSIVAPKAAINISGTNIGGAVIAKSFTASGNNVVGGLNFQLAGAPAVPEPSSWAMMILGLGVVGGALRRYRRNVTREPGFSAC